MPREHLLSCLLAGRETYIAPQLLAARMYGEESSSAEFLNRNDFACLPLHYLLCGSFQVFSFLLDISSFPFRYDATTSVSQVCLSVFSYIIKTPNVSNFLLLCLILTLPSFTYPRSSPCRLTQTHRQSFQSSSPQPSTQLMAAAPVGQGCYLS